MSAQGDHVECARQLLQHKAPIDDVTVVGFIWRPETIFS